MADSIYWTTYDGTIRGAPLAGGGTPDTLYDWNQGVNIPLGVAIDPVAGRIYWANDGDHTIRRGSLAGGGTPDTLYGPGQGVSYPFGVAIDPAAGWIYWSNAEWDSGAGGTIRRAPLAGGGTPNTLYGPMQGVSGPTGIAIDKAAGRIYWANSAVATILGAPLAGGGNVDTLYGSADGVFAPIGVAIDKAAGRIYWTNREWATSVGGGTLRGAPLSGRAAGGTVDILYGLNQVRAPGGVAIDPNPAAPGPERLQLADTERLTIGRWFRDFLFPPSVPPARIYWANGITTTGGQAPIPNDNTIRGAPLVAGGTVDTLYGAAQGLSNPTAVAVLRAPLGTGLPMISFAFVLPDDSFGGWQFGGGHSGPLDRRLSCSQGSWATDLPASLLYRAPQSFAYQWSLGGTDIPGATSAHYMPTASGSYSCRVTATNRAGSASQTSAPFAAS